MTEQMVMWRAAGLGLALCAVAGTAWASNGGLLPTGISAKDKGMGGAGMAIARDAVAAINNPAATVVVGNQFTLGLTILYEAAQFDISGAGTGPFPLEPGKTDNNERWFPIPFLSATYRIDDRWAVGFSAYGLFGLGVAYPQHPRSNCTVGIPAGPLCGGKSTLDTSALFVTPTLAYRLTPEISIGVSPALVYSRFEAKGFSAFGPASSAPGDLTNNGADQAFGYAGKIGVHYQGDGFSAGVTYQTEANMQRYKKYRGLLPEGANFDLPAILAAGVAYDLADDYTVAVDFQYVFYSDVPALANRFVNPLVPGNPALGTDNGAGFGWKDQWTLHLGTEHRYSDTLALRAGYSYTSRLYRGRDSLLNAMAPAIMRHNIAAGFSQELFSGTTLDFGITYALPLDQYGSNPLSPDQRIRSTHGILEGALGINYAW